MKDSDKHQAGLSGQFSLFFEHCPYTIIEVNSEGRMLNANPAAAQIFRVPFRELVDKSFLQYLSPKEAKKFIKYLQKETGSIKTGILLEDQSLVPVEITAHRFNDPSLKTLLLLLKPISDKKGIKQEKQKVNRSISAKREKKTELKQQLAELEKLNQTLQKELKFQKENQEEIRKNTEKFRDLTEMLPEMVFEADSHGNITFINQKGVQILGYTRKEILNEKTIGQLIARNGNNKSKANMENLFQKVLNYPQEYYLIGKDQVKIPVEIHGSLIRNNDGKLIGFRGIVLDITERKEYEDKIKYLSFHDKLTGLYNRAYFEEELKRLNSKRNLPISIIIGDVNNLKMINDTFGHQHGDRLLIKIASVLQSCFRKSDVISRWGGDEFSIILPHTSREKGISIINRINEVCQKKSTLTLPLSISMGIATKTDMSENINATVREAESKMYRYKLIDKQVAESNLVSSF